MNQNENQGMNPLEDLPNTQEPINPADANPQQEPILPDEESIQEEILEEEIIEEEILEEEIIEEEILEEEIIEEDVAPVETQDDMSSPVEQVTPPSEETATQQPTQESPKAEQPTAQPQQQTYTYHWSYGEQKAHDDAQSQKKRVTGVWVYALVMTAVFALSFGLLLGVMFMKGEEFPIINIGESHTSEEDIADREAIAPVEAAKRSVVVIEVTSATASSSGTGIILSADGYIATNHHVVDGGGSIRVRFYDGTYAAATLQGSSKVDDLAVIKVEKSGLTPATFAKSSECYVGETVYAIGNPGGPDFAWTTTKGIISYVNREVKIYKDDGTMEKKLKLLQTDAMVNPGNSGGPLVNRYGEVVGVVSMKLADGYEGIGFAIPADGAVEILNAIIRDGNADSINSNISYDRAVIGIVGVYMEGGKHYVLSESRIQEVPEGYQSSVQEVISPKVSGIYVTDLTEGMDAATKLMVGDIITQINGVEATNMNILMSVLNEHYVGDVVEVTYYRGALYDTVNITLSAAQ